MVERLKRWESPRKRGRNDKGKGGSARARQLRKREQMLRQKLQRQSVKKSGKSNSKERGIMTPLFCAVTNKLFLAESYLHFGKAKL